MISGFVWNSKKKKKWIKYCTLLLERDKGGMALRTLKDYYRAAQFRPVIKWFDEGWLHCKVDIERALARHSNPVLDWQC